MTSKSWSVEMDRRVEQMRLDPVRYLETARRKAGKRVLPWSEVRKDSTASKATRKS